MTEHKFLDYVIFLLILAGLWFHLEMQYAVSSSLFLFSIFLFVRQKTLG